MTSSSLLFGALDEGWIYHPGSKLYDLTRNAPAPFLAFGATAGRPKTTVLIKPAMTALVVVDMQNLFLHPRCNDHHGGLEAAKRTVKVIEKCRELGIQIIWLNWGLTESDLYALPPSVHRSFSSHLVESIEHGKKPSKDQTRIGPGSDLGSGRGRLLMTNSWNTELYEPLLEVSNRGTDIFCNKDRMSGMWTDGTPLHRVVKDDFRTLLFAGVNTDQCVLGTLVDAYNRGFDCVMLEDCCATKTPAGKEVTSWNVSRNYGFVTNSESFCNGSASSMERESSSFRSKL